VTGRYDTTRHEVSPIEDRRYCMVTERSGEEGSKWMIHQ